MIHNGLSHRRSGLEEPPHRAVCAPVVYVGAPRQFRRGNKKEHRRLLVARQWPNNLAWQDHLVDANGKRDAVEDLGHAILAKNEEMPR